MKNIISEFCWQGTNLCLRYIENSLDLLIVLLDHLLKTNKEFKDLWRLQNTFTEMN